MCKVLLNNELNGVELYFNGKPSQEIREEMKDNGFRWNGKKVCWYAKQNNKTMVLANKLSGSSVLEVAPVKTAKKENKIDLWALTQYVEVEREKSYNTKEIAKEIRTHLKARFKFVKFSVTSKDRISVEIKSAPFEKDSVYLKTITEYVDKLVNSFNFCTCYDPYGDYGSSYNFYYFGCKLYDYEQVEASQEIIEAMKHFDIKVAEAEKTKKEQEEKEYQEYLIKVEQEKKEAEERQKQIKEDKEYINNNVEVVDLEEQDQYFVKNAYFANLNKNNTLEQYQEEVSKGDYYLNTLKVTREIHFNDEKSYNLYINMLLHDFDFIDGTGGSYTDDLRINSMTDYYNMSGEEQKTVEWLLQGVAIYVNNELMFVVDAQGYCYARYVGIIGENTATTKEYTCKQVVTVEEIEERKIEAEEVQEVYNNVINNNSFDNWYSTRKAIAKAIRKNPLLTFDSTVVQQIKDEKIKNDLYRVLSEVDAVQDQFNDSDLKQGDKLTIVRGSMIGGASISHITLEAFTMEEYAQYKDNVKMTMSVKGKKGLYSTNVHGKDIVIYKGWINVPTSVLYEDTSNKNFIGKATKYGSYDERAINDIMSYLQGKNILPIINTFKPVF